MRNDYIAWSDSVLAKELSDLDKDIEYWQRVYSNARKTLNELMESREDVIQIMKERGKTSNDKK